MGKIKDNNRDNGKGNSNSSRCIDVIRLMEKYAEPSLAESWDNIGLMVGDENAYITNVLVALDINDDVIEEAILKECNLIITHHPFIFKGLKSITTSDVIGTRVMKLIKNNINVFSAHTNLDIAKNGTNDTLANLLNLKNMGNLFDNNNSEWGLGRVGELEESLKLGEVIDEVKKVLDLGNIVVCGDINKEIKRIGICTGAGGEVDFINQAIVRGCDLYITADLKYHNAQHAKDLGLCLIDATHYASENIIVPVVRDYLNKCARKLNLNFRSYGSEVDGQMFKIY